MLTRPSASNMSSDIARYFEFAKNLTLQAGEILQNNLLKIDKVVEYHTHTSYPNLVTDTDHAIEKLFIDSLSKEFPDHIIIAEESSLQKLTELTDTPTWFIDPIDGTTNFVHTFPMSCVSVGLTVGKEPVLGIIYNPSHSELYTATKGGGAFLNGKPIRTSRVTEMKKAVIGLEMGTLQHTGTPKDIRTMRLESLILNTEGARAIGSAAMSMAYVARGALDCFHMAGLQPWDIMAGTVILREAGGTVIDTKGGNYNIMKPETVAASCEALARELSKFIVDTDLQTQRNRLKRN